MFDAVLFDCDGVLVDSEVCFIRAERRVLRALNLDYPHEVFVRRFVGLHDAAFFETLQADHLDRHGRDAPATMPGDILAARKQELASLTAIEGARGMLEHVREAEKGVAVASSSHAVTLEDNLRRMGLWNLAAPHVYSADLVAAGKPAPDIFLYAAARIGADPARCLVIEDSENGVRAGRAAGMTVWGFIGGGHCVAGTGQRLTAAGASWVAPDFVALIDRFRPASIPR